MQTSRVCLGRFIPWKRTPGSVWGGKERKIPRLTHARKEAFLNHMLLSEQNHRYLQRPCISREVEATVLEEERARELRREDEVFYARYVEQFNKRFPSRNVQSHWDILLRQKKFDL